MSIFSKIKGAKKAADEKKANDSTQKPPAQPYRHVPTHAAADALMGAPPSGHHPEDRAAIKAAHKKRKSDMSRQSSALSTVTISGSQNGENLHAGEWRNSSVDQRQPRSQTRTSRRSQTQFQSLHGMVVPEGEISEFSSQRNSPGHSPSGSNSSRESSYVEMPYRQTKQDVPEPPAKPQAAARKLGEAPRLLEPPVRPASMYGKPPASSVTEMSGPPSKKRKSWMPFSHAKPAAVAAH